MMKNVPYLLCTIITVFILPHNEVQSEVYTALVEMEELLETEAVLISNLNKYIDIQQEKLDFLKKYKTIFIYHILLIFYKE